MWQHNEYAHATIRVNCICVSFMLSPDYIVCQCDAEYNVDDIFGCALTTLYAIRVFCSSNTQRN